MSERDKSWCHEMYCCIALKNKQMVLWRWEESVDWWFREFRLWVILL